ncbi:fasciclin domain-containing protein [Streptomyces tropicalis]|uniref:Fasciclin domain-containing protein n=1 Tax=Streptomyces tropicalis TaxID=3034234 RepID=A0ABT6A3Q6_9ACTN|nr:fasciclin domain-containing protein [Streptomyces tropicalis]MDF3299273.1 fasciclin domain-containing protein [Streptomyces tropicalis]
MKSTRTRTTVAVAAAIPLACAGLAPHAFADSARTDSPSPGSPSPSSSVTPFGPGCSSLPNKGDGSAVAMAREKVANAVAANPKLSQLAAALKKAGLDKTLNDAKKISVFAPTDEAFKKLSKSQLQSLMNNPGELKKILTYHVVDQEITRSELPSGSFKTREGSMLTTSGSGDMFKVDKTANITCGDLKAANATVFLVDQVLTPPK